MCTSATTVAVCDERKDQHLVTILEDARQEDARQEDATQESAAAVPNEFADPEVGGLAGVIDLDRYPIGEPNTAAWDGIVDVVRRQLEADGCATLRDFLTPDALHAVGCEIAQIATHVPIRTHGSTVYHRTELERELPAHGPAVANSNGVRAT